MSQRLAIEFRSNGHFLGACCERWGAYTACAAYEMDRIMDWINSKTFRDLDENGRILRQSNPHKIVLDCCRDDEWSGFPLDNEKESKEYRQYADGEIIVDIGRKTIHFDVFSHFNKSEAEEEFGITDDKLSELTKVPNEISFDEWPDFSDKFDVQYPEVGYFVDEDNNFMSDIC